MELRSASLGSEASRFFVNRYTVRIVLRLRTLIALSFSLLLFPIDSQAQDVNICDRTDQIETAILAELPAGTDCARVNPSDLAAITIVDAKNKSILQLKEGDFSGLTRLESLLLYRNSLSSLHEDLFDGLSNLDQLYLDHNLLTQLPEDLFDGLTSLIDLALYDNSLTSLHEDLFEDLTSLGYLWLNQNNLTSLDEDLFDGLTNLKDLWLYQNDLTSLHEDLFDGLTSLERLWLQSNSLTSLPEDVFDGLISLEQLMLSGNSLTSLPEDVFDGLISLEELMLQHNSLTSLPENLFDHVKSPQKLEVNLTGNQIACLPAKIVNNSAVILTPMYPACGGVTATLLLSPASISENGGSTTVTARLDQPSSEMTTISVSAHPRSPALSSDYILSGTTLTIAAGQTTSTGDVTITAVDNDVDAPDKTITIRGSASNTAGVTGPADVTLRITDDDVAMPAVTLFLSPASISENGGSTTVTATLDRVSSEMTTISVSADPQAPALSSDYILSGTTLTIAAGQTTSSGDVTITAVDNDVDAPDKTITIRGSASNTAGVTGPGDITLTITDDDAMPAVTLVLSPASIRENGGSTTVTATLDRPSSETTTISVSADPQPPALSSDYILSGTTLTIAAGQTTSTGDVTITAVDNDVDAPDKTIIIRGSASNTVGVTGPADITLTITDDDVAIPAVTLLLSPASIHENGGSTTVTAALDRTSSEMTTISVSADPQPPALSSDYILSGTTLTIAAGQTTSTGDVTITAVDNDVDAPDKTIIIRGSASNTVGVTGPADITLTITDDDVAAVTAPASIVVPEGGSRDLPVALSAEPTAEVTLTIAGHAGTDLTPTPPALIFTPTNWNAPQTVVLAAAEDLDFSDDPVTLTLAASGGGYAGVTHSAAVTITDNDVASIAALASVAVPEGGFRDLPVSLSSQPTANVTLTVAGHAATDLTPTPQTLIFTTTNWSTEQTMHLTAAEDDDFVNDEVTLTLMGSGGGYTGVTHSVAVTINDNDVASITAPASIAVPEGSSMGLPVMLSAQPAGAVTVTVAGHAGTDLTPAPQTLTFTATNWSTVQTVGLTAAEDEDYTDDPVALTLTASGGGYTGVTHSVAATIIDNDLAPLSVSIFDLTRREDAKTGQLRVELSRPSDETVVVQYKTSDGTAEAPSDYVSSQGFVVFSRNATKGVISVGIVDDAIAEEDETLTLTLSNPRNAIIERGVGTLTIVDDDGGVTLHIEDEVVQESAGMVRFTVHLSEPSSQPVSVSYRTRNGTAKAGEDYRAVAGVLEFAPGAVAAMIAVPLLRDDLDWRQETFSVHLEQSTHAKIAKAVAVATIREAGSVTRNVLAAYAARFVRTSSVQVVEALQERFRSGADASVCAAGDRADLVRLWQTASDWRPSLGELLGGCHVSRSTAAPGGRFGVWGRGAFRRFRGRGTGALRLRGSVSTGLFGVDYRWDERWMAGLVVAHSRGDGSFAGHEDTGKLSSGLTGMYPYVAYQHPTGGGIWMSGGYGRGRAEGMDLSGRLTSGFGALGVRGTLVSMQALRLSYHGDVWYADAAVSDLDVTAQVYQTRLGMEALLDLGDRVRPYVEANVRQDGGSAETGLGMELGGGVRVSVPAWHLKGEVRSRGLVLHAEDGFTEWGISGSVQVGGGTEPWMLRVRPSWGANQGLALNHQQTVLDAVQVGRALHRTEMELGYGIPMRQGTARSVLGATWQPGGALLRLGGVLHPRDRFTVAVYGLVHAHAATLGDVGLNLQGSLQY